MIEPSVYHQVLDDTAQIAQRIAVLEWLGEMPYLLGNRELSK